MFKREPDIIIGEQDDPYLFRWWLIPRNKYFNIYLHKFLRSDDSRSLHDHPWFNISVILWGSYTEIMPANRFKWLSEGDRKVIRKRRYPFIPIFRDANWIHRVELDSQLHIDIEDQGDAIKEKPVWTLFITGPWRRRWGFHCPKEWRHWQEYVEITDGGNSIGRGCD